MTPEDRALAALRRLDRPTRPGAEALERIELQMLDRFDTLTGRNPHGVDLELIELDVGVAERRPRSSWARPLLAAAAVVMLVAGLVVFSSLRARDAEVPSTEPTVSPDDADRIADQLLEYCEEFLPPVDDAAARFDEGLGGSAARLSTLIAVEQAAQGLADLPAPAGPRVTPQAQSLLVVTADARLALSVEVGETNAVVDVLDALDATIEQIPEAADVSACERP